MRLKKLWREVRSGSENVADVKIDAVSDSVKKCFIGDVAKLAVHGDAVEICRNLAIATWFARTPDLEAFLLVKLVVGSAS